MKTKTFLLFFWGLIPFFSFAYNPLITGPFRVTANSFATYTLTMGPEYDFGVKATWKVEGGVFDSNNSTTLQQSVSQPSVDIKWGAVGVGKITYYYKSGSGEAYESFTFVSIDAPPPGGNGNGNGSGSGSGSVITYLPIPRYMFTYDVYDFGAYSGTLKLDKVEAVAPYLWKIPLNRKYFERWMAVKPTSSPINVTVRLKGDNILDSRKDSKTFTFDIIERPSMTSSATAVCSSGNSVTYRLNNAAFDSRTMRSISITWIPVNNLSLQSGQGTTSATFRAIGNNGTTCSVHAQIKYTFLDGSTQTIRLIQNSVVIGGPTVTGFTNLNPGARFTPGLYYIFLAGDENLERQNVNWKLEGGAGVATLRKINNSSAQLNISSTQSQVFFVVRADVSNSCSSRTIAVGAYAVNYGSYSLRNDSITMNTNEVDILKKIKQIRIYSISGQTVYSTNEIDDFFNYQNLGLKRGIYIIEKTDQNNKCIREKMFIK